MLRTAKELWLALLVCILLAGMYAGIMALTREIPAAGEFYGHTLGIIGFILMLLTETLIVDTKRCTGCGTCVAVCPFGALKLVPSGTAPSDMTGIDHG